MQAVRNLLHPSGSSDRSRIGLGLVVLAACLLSSVCTGGGGGGGGSTTATITIGAAGSCPGGAITVSSASWVQQGGNAWLLKVKVCVKCPNSSGAMAGVTGATVKGSVLDDSVTLPDNLTSASGTTAAGGCVTLSKRMAATVKSQIAGKTYRVLFEDPTGRTLGRTTVTLPN